MFKITSAERFVMAPPNQGWTLEEGANHFDSAMPDAVAKKLRELVTKGFVKVELLDLNANSTPWEAEKPAEEKKPELQTHDSIMPLDPVSAMADVVAPKSVFPAKK